MLKKKLLFLVLIFIATFPTIYLWAVGYASEYLEFKLSRVFNCLFGMEPLTFADPASCSDFSKFLLIRDALLFAFYPLSILLLIGLMIYGAWMVSHGKKR